MAKLRFLTWLELLCWHDSGWKGFVLFWITFQVNYKINWKWAKKLTGLYPEKNRSFEKFFEKIAVGDVNQWCLKRARQKRVVLGGSGWHALKFFLNGAFWHNLELIFKVFITGFPQRSGNEIPWLFHDFPCPFFSEFHDFVNKFKNVNYNCTASTSTAARSKAKPVVAEFLTFCM